MGYKKSTSIRQRIINEERSLRESYTLTTYATYFEIGLKTLKFISKCFPEIVLSDININKMTRSLNFWIFKILTEKSKEIIEFDFNQYKVMFSWESMISLIHDIYINFYDKTEFIKSMLAHQPK